MKLSVKHAAVYEAVNEEEAVYEAIGQYEYVF
jgi:hypothetical protein